MKHFDMCASWDSGFNFPSNPEIKFSVQKNSVEWGSAPKTCISSQNGHHHLYCTASRLAVGTTQPSNWWTLDALSPGLKRPRLGAVHSSTSSAEVKNGGALPPPHTSPWHGA
jgi:hypothetical protein